MSSTEGRRISVFRKLYYSNLWNSICAGWNHHFHFVIVFISKTFPTGQKNSWLQVSAGPWLWERIRNKSGITFGENWDTVRSDTLLHISPPFWMFLGTHNVRIKKPHALFFTHIPPLCCNSCKDTFLKVTQGSFSGNSVSQWY